MDEAKRKRANLVRILIRRGWNPPPPTDEILEELTRDLAALRSGARTSPTNELTPRGRECLALLADGHGTYAEVAAVLGVGEETVREHVKRSIARLGARNQTHAVALAIRRGLIA